MKNKIVFGIIIVCTIVISVLIIKRNDIYHKYVNDSIEKKVIKELNGEFDENTANFTIKGYNVHAKTNNELNHYDITKLVEIYLNIVEEGIEMCSLRNNEKDVEYKFENSRIGQINNDFERGKDIIMECNLEYGYSEDYDENDIINYKNGSFRNIIIEKLKKILDYEEKDGEIVWQINSVNDEIIELPNNFYLDYRSDKTEKNDRFKKAIDVLIDDNFSYEKKEGSRNTIIIRYETNDGKTEEKETELIYRDGKYGIEVSGILSLKIGDVARINLSNHTCDRVTEEKMREYELNDDFEPDSYR